MPVFYVYHFLFDVFKDFISFFCLLTLSFSPTVSLNVFLILCLHPWALCILFIISEMILFYFLQFLSSYLSLSLFFFFIFTYCFSLTSLRSKDFRFLISFLFVIAYLTALNSFWNIVFLLLYIFWRVVDRHIFISCSILTPPTFVL